MQPLNVGLVGCGAISRNYLKNAANLPSIRFAACCDLMSEKAHELAEEFGIPKAYDQTERLVGDPEVEAVLNLTIPSAHAPVAMQAIEAGKHVYSEKPLALDFDEGKQVTQAAAAKGVRVGNAPDTFLGAAHQTARKLIDEGAIGQPVAATALMMGGGVEGWHPNPRFYYEPGGGPMFDMGPYYLTALMFLLGPIKSVQGSAKIAIPRRHVTAEKCPYRGEIIDVQTPDFVAGSIEFHSGVIATIITSFATPFPAHDGKHPITVFGTEGSIKAADPNNFDGGIELIRSPEQGWQEVPHWHTRGYGRSAGLGEMAQAIREDRPHRASGQLSLAVLEAMQGFLESAKTGQAYQLTTRLDQPAPLPPYRKRGDFG
jgi:predicted dehydrogenase